MKEKHEPINRDFVSEADQFLSELVNSLASKSASRVLEHDSYKKLFDARDKPKVKKPQDLSWKDF
jgi:hypothetical protein